MIPSQDKRLAEQEGLQRMTQAANLPVVDENTASPEVRQLYQRFREGFGRPQVPGILQCFATHPPLLEHMLGLAKDMLFVDGALGRQNKELISAFVSATNRCAYCADSHAYAFRMQGGSQATVRAVLACDLPSEHITPQQRTLLEFARTITQDAQAVTPTDIERMRASGWSDLQIAETIHVTALFATFNRVVNAFGLPSQQLLDAFEPEEATYGR